MPLLGGCALWAMAPIEPRAAVSVEVSGDFSTRPAQAEDPFDVRPFQRARLWVDAEQAGAAGEDAAASNSAGSPLRLQLLGITTEGKDLVACLYDPAADEILLVRNGDRVGAHHVSRVAPREVAFRGDEGEVVVALARSER